MRATRRSGSPAWRAPTAECSVAARPPAQGQPGVAHRVARELEALVLEVDAEPPVEAPGQTGGPVEVRAGSARRIHAHLVVEAHRLELVLPGECPRAQPGAGPLGKRVLVPRRKRPAFARFRVHA